MYFFLGFPERECELRSPSFACVGIVPPAPAAFALVRVSQSFREPVGDPVVKIHDSAGILNENRSNLMRNHGFSRFPNGSCVRPGARVDDGEAAELVECAWSTLNLRGPLPLPVATHVLSARFS
jgi:hypothetical protein